MVVLVDFRWIIQVVERRYIYNTYPTNRSKYLGAGGGKWYAGAYWRIFLVKLGDIKAS